MTARRKRLVLVACILGTAVVTVDATVVNVALPAIADDLGGGLAGQHWTANAYLVTLGSLLLIGGSLGDVFGERRVFALRVAGFGRHLGAVRRRADDRAAGGGPCAPGGIRRAAHAGGSCRDRGGLPG
jgi:MFS family permease